MIAVRYFDKHVWAKEIPQPKRHRPTPKPKEWETKYKIMAKVCHPDKGGSAEAMSYLNELKAWFEDESPSEYKLQLKEWLDDNGIEEHTRVKVTHGANGTKFTKEIK